MIGAGGFSLGFVSLLGGGGGSSEETHFHEHIKRVELSFKRLEEYDVIRGSWFQPILFDTYGKTVPGYWGPGGLLACYPLSVALGRGLTITLSIDDVQHDTFKKHAGGEGGIGIGPFVVGGGGGGDSTLDNYHEEHDKFTVKDSDMLARVIAEHHSACRGLSMGCGTGCQSNVALPAHNQQHHLNHSSGLPTRRGQMLEGNGRRSSERDRRGLGGNPRDPSNS